MTFAGLLLGAHSVLAYTSDELAASNVTPTQVKALAQDAIANNQPTYVAYVDDQEAQLQAANAGGINAPAALGDGQMTGQAAPADNQVNTVVTSINDGLGTGNILNSQNDAANTTAKVNQLRAALGLANAGDDLTTAASELRTLIEGTDNDDSFRTKITNTRALIAPAPADPNAPADTELPVDTSAYEGLRRALGQTPLNSVQQNDLLKAFTANAGGAVNVQAPTRLFTSIQEVVDYVNGGFAPLPPL